MTRLLSRTLQLTSLAAITLLLVWLSGIVPEGFARAVVNLVLFGIALAAPLVILAIFMGWLDKLNPLMKIGSDDKRKNWPWA